MHVCVFSEGLSGTSVSFIIVSSEHSVSLTIHLFPFMPLFFCYNYFWCNFVFVLFAVLSFAVPI